MQKSSVLGMIFLLLLYNSIMADDDRDHIIEVVNRDLPMLLEGVREDNKELFGFLKDDKIENVEIGDAFKIMYLRTNKIDKYKKNSPIYSLIDKNDYTWGVLLAIDGNARCMARVTRKDKDWVISYIGDYNAAIEMANLIEGIKSKSDIPIFLEEPMTYSFFCHYEKIDDKNLNELDIPSPHKKNYTKNKLKIRREGYLKNTDAALTLKKLKNKIAKLPRGGMQ